MLNLIFGRPSWQNDAARLMAEAIRTQQQRQQASMQAAKNSFQDCWSVNIGGTNIRVAAPAVVDLIEIDGVWQLPPSTAPA